MSSVQLPFWGMKRESFQFFTWNKKRGKSEKINDVILCSNFDLKEENEPQVLNISMWWLSADMSLKMKISIKWAWKYLHEELDSDAPQVQLTFWFQDIDLLTFQPCFKADVFYWWSLGEILHSPTILKGNGDVSGWWSSLLPWKRLPHSELLLPWRDCLLCLPQSGHDSPPTCSFLEGLGSKRFLSWKMMGRNNSWWFVGREVLHSLRDHPNIKWFIVMVCFKGHTVNGYNAVGITWYLCLVSDQHAWQ